MGYAELIDGCLRLRLFDQGGIVTTEPPIPHNVYLFANTVIHTVKHGEESDVEDRIRWPALDSLTTILSESDLIRLSQN
jgi:hypothetical protein